MSGMPAIEFLHVSKTRPRDTGRKRWTEQWPFLFRHRETNVSYALTDLSFAIQPGESVAIIGPNGAGKSTLLSLIAGLTTAEKGRVLVSARVAALLQSGIDFRPGLSGAQNLRLRASTMGPAGVPDQDSFHRIVEFSGLGQWIHDPVRSYSEGMKLRLAFSLAVCSDAEVLVVDDVLAPGDQVFQARCLEKLTELHRAGKTLVCASHSAPFLLEFCEGAIWLESGRVVKVGSARDVIREYRSQCPNSLTKRRVWIDVGAHSNPAGFAAAEGDPTLRVFAFEPQIRTVAKRIGQLPNYVVMPMAISAQEAPGPCVSTTRLDSFLEDMGVDKVEWLRTDASSLSAEMVRSAGARLADISRISVLVPSSDPKGHDALDCLQDTGFRLLRVAEQPDVAAESYTFVQDREYVNDEDGRLLSRARQLTVFQPPMPDPGWHFDIDWDSSDPVLRERRSIWQHFRSRNCLGALETVWLNGVRLVSYLGNDLSKQLFIAGRFEPNEFAMLDRILQPGMVFVDCGANEGLYTLFAASRVGRAGAVLAFEPSPREFARLRWNCRLNDFPAIQLYPVALSDGNGEAELAVASAEHAGQNSLGGMPAGVEVRGRIQVRTMRLDDVPGVGDLPRLDLVKMDVEGEEHQLLLGAERSIHKHRPMILFECSDQLLRTRGSSAAGIQELLRSWNYEIYGFAPGTGEPTPIRSDTDALNLIAYPTERSFRSERRPESPDIELQVSQS